jgi:hypothetical protein
MNTIVNIPQNVGSNENCHTYIFIYDGPCAVSPNGILFKAIMKIAF